MNPHLKTAAAAALLALACGGGNRNQTASRDSVTTPPSTPGMGAGAPDTGGMAGTTPPAGSQTSATPTPATNAPTSQPRPAGLDASVLLGSWTVHRVPTLPGTPQLELAVDSVAGDRFRTRLVFYMAGDVGGSPSSYRPEWGILKGNVAQFPVATRAPGPLMGEMTGTLQSRDTVLLSSYRWGGEERIRADQARWYLVRGK